MKLNACQIETAKPKDKAYKMADGMKLYLEVTLRGSKYWRMKYRRPSHKKEDRLAFGVWHLCQRTILLLRWRLQIEESTMSLLDAFYYTFTSDAFALDKGLAESEKKRSSLKTRCSALMCRRRS